MTLAKHQPDDGRQWRQMPTEYRRKQLIEATIDVIAEVGLSRATVSLVSKKAELSPAVINLQFQSKDNMLVETLKYVREEFNQAWRKANEAGGENGNAADKVQNLLGTYFRPEICDPKKLRVWFAFFGEAAARETYLDITRRYEAAVLGVLRDGCAVLIEEGGYDWMDPHRTARSLLASCDGLWMGLMLRPDTISPEQCVESLNELLASHFPKHFGRLPDET
ncbi:transcriptional regulator, TetR family [Shimia gijangensis]|uniref:Transcriptional regulator, TetR family n=1 Tax=Shimia gijangensis TaxID=1470563 RepID=A0A1M6S3S2_9RHOB|nr:TetR family transcriptional regulator C-terminal domain-containing protein [Shimia gijangensis]SHK39331.1 transcriptional regulator, TetR family [Shimia gijangensis]